MDTTTIPQRACGLTIAALLLIGVATPHALAQQPPNPFDDYTMRRDEAERTAATPVGASQAAPATAPERVSAQAAEPLGGPHILPTQRGQLALHLSGAFQFASSSSGVPGGDVSDSNLFARLTPGLGYFLRDNLELGGNLGVMSRRVARDSDSGATSTDLVLEAFVRYHQPLGQRFMVIPSASLGGFIGSSARELSIITNQNMVQRVNEETSTSGMILSGALQIGYAFRPDLMLEAGITMTGLLASERFESDDARFWGWHFNSGLGLQASYFF